MMNLKSLIVNTVIGVLIGSIIVTCKIRAFNKPEDNVKPFDYIEPSTGYIVEETMMETFPETSTTPTTITPEEVEWEPYPFIPLDDTVQLEIKKLCDKYEIHYNIIMALAKTETQFNSNAVSKDGHDFGLYQIRDIYWEQTAIDNGLYDWKTNPVQNANLALIILRINFELAEGRLEECLMLYNTGEMNGFPMYDDGTNYYIRFQNNLHWIEQQLTTY